MIRTSFTEIDARKILHLLGLHRHTTGVLRATVQGRSPNQAILIVINRLLVLFRSAGNLLVSAGCNREVEALQMIFVTFPA